MKPPMEKGPTGIVVRFVYDDEGKRTNKVVVHPRLFSERFFLVEQLDLVEKRKKT